MATTPNIILQKPLLPGAVRDDALQQTLKVAQDAINALQARTDAAGGTVTQVDTTAPLSGGPITTTGTLSLLGGPVNWNFIKVTGTYTVLDSDVTIFVDNSGGVGAVILPPPSATSPSRILNIHAQTVANDVTLSCSGGGTIEASATQTLIAAGGYAGQTIVGVILQSDGTTWRTLSTRNP